MRLRLTRSPRVLSTLRGGTGKSPQRLDAGFLSGMPLLCAALVSMFATSVADSKHADLTKHAVIRKLLGTFAYWPDLFVLRRKRHAFDHSNYHFDSVADWSIANLAV
jgi:hypothetical protein